MSKEDSRRLRQISRFCLEKGYELEKIIFLQHPRVLEEKKHLSEGETRAYWTSGYLQALKDLKRLADKGELVPVLAEDGGPPKPLKSL